MNDSWRRWRWALFAAMLSLGAFALAVRHDGLFPRMGVNHMKPLFLDLHAILAAGQAHQQGIDVYAGNPLDPLGRPHVYGPVWLATGSWGLRMGDASWIGACLALVFVGTVIFMFNPRDARGALIVTGFVLAPPVLLGLERANNDLMIFLLLAFSAIPIRQGVVGSWLACVMLSLAAILKFYPAVCLVALFASGKGLRRPLLQAVLGAAMIMAFWFVDRVEIARVLGQTPQPVTIFAYGWRLLQSIWQILVPERLWLLLTFAPSAILAGRWLWRARAELGAALPLHGTNAAAALAGGTAWVFCYFSTTNFPYRLVLLLLLWPALRDETGTRGGRQLGWLMFALAWLALPKFWLAVLVEKAGILTDAMHVLSLIVGIDQALALAVTLAIAWTLWGWMRRWWSATVSDPVLLGRSA